jgi:hypothetical protein
LNRVLSFALAMATSSVLVPFIDSDAGESSNAQENQDTYAFKYGKF